MKRNDMKPGLYMRLLRRMDVSIFLADSIARMIRPNCKILGAGMIVKRVGPP